MCDGLSELPPGARPIGDLDEASPPMQVVVGAMRGWLEGACGQQAIWNIWATHTSPSKAHAMMAAFETFMVAVAAHSRQKLYRHTSSCSCLGADEVVVASIVEFAAARQPETAYELAARVIEPAGLRDVLIAAQSLAMIIGPAASLIGPEISSWKRGALKAQPEEVSLIAL